MIFVSLIVVVVVGPASMPWPPPVMRLCSIVIAVAPGCTWMLPVETKRARVRCEPERLAPEMVAWPGFSARSVTPGAAFDALSVTLLYEPLARHTIDPAAAEETAVCAVETLDTVLVQVAGGGGGGGGTASTGPPRLPGGASTLPAASFARTEKRCGTRVRA